MKKGFTLVELLAVIAILAILVIIALPNIMGMFNQAKKNSFTTEIKEIYKVAQQTWMSESMFNTSDKVYSRCSGCTNPLDLSGREELEYYIKIDKSGKVVKFFATDNTYQYSFDNNSGLKIEDIKDVDQVTDVSPSNVLHITSDGAELGEVTYLYFSNDVNWDRFYIGSSVPSLPYEYLFNNYQDAMNDKELPYFIRLKVSGGIVRGIDIGYLLNNKIYYVNRQMSAQEIQNVFANSFGADNCNFSNSNSFSCTISGGLHIWYGYGDIEVYYDDEYWFCGDHVANGAYCTQP